MKGMELSLNAPGAQYFPGEELRGTLDWELESDPARLEIALFWSTEGKGSGDSHTVATEVLESPGPQGRREFRFQLPEAPHSFQGRLISLIWGVEAICKKPRMQAFASFVMAPGGEALSVGEPEEGDMHPKVPFKIRKR